MIAADMSPGRWTQHSSAAERFIREPGQTARPNGTRSPFLPAVQIGGWIRAPATGPAPGEEES